jgi:hypothetical protein
LLDRVARRRLFPAEFAQSFQSTRQYLPRLRTTILRPAASQDRLSQIETRGDSNAIQQAVFELFERACKRIRGQKSLHAHLNRVHQEREVVAWKLSAQYRDPRTLARV